MFGDVLLDGKLGGPVHGDECSWCLVEGGTELQLLLAATSLVKWPALLKD